MSLPAGRPVVARFRGRARAPAQQLAAACPRGAVIFWGGVRLCRAGERTCGGPRPEHDDYGVDAVGPPGDDGRRAAVGGGHPAGVPAGRPPLPRQRAGDATVQCDAQRDAGRGRGLRAGAQARVGRGGHLRGADCDVGAVAAGGAVVAAGGGEHGDHDPRVGLLDAGGGVAAVVPVVHGDAAAQGVRLPVSALAAVERRGGGVFDPGRAGLPVARVVAGYLPAGLLQVPEVHGPGGRGGGRGTAAAAGPAAHQPPAAAGANCVCAGDGAGAAVQRERVAHQALWRTDPPQDRGLGHRVAPLPLPGRRGVGLRGLASPGSRMLLCSLLSLGSVQATCGPLSGLG